MRVKQFLSAHRVIMLTIAWFWYSTKWIAERQGDKMAEPTERIPQHKHCVVCGKAFVDGIGRYCSTDCKESKTAELKKTKNKLLIIWVIAAAIMVGAICVIITTGKS